jgi:hypothetical protein
MEIPNLPTDNLYKFMALSGVLIILVFISMYTARVSTLNENINNETAEIEELKFEKLLLAKKDSLLDIDIHELSSKMSKYKYDSTNLEKNISDLREVLKDPNNREYLKFFYTYEDDLIPEKKIFDDIVERTKSGDENRNLIQQKQNTIFIKDNKINKDVRSLIEFKWIIAIGILIGLFLSIYGFFLWYLKVQKFLDKILINDSRKS